MKTKSYEIQFHEVDCKNRLKESVLLNFMQDMAAADAEDIGLGYSKIRDKNYGWFLMKYHIKLFNTLKNDGKLSIFTKSVGAIKLSCFRDFDIFDANNNKVGEATSSWVLTDLNNGSILMPMNIFEGLQAADRNTLRSNFPKIPALERVDYQKNFKVMYSDLDVNNHVNNAIYLTWAENTLPIDILLNTRIAELEIQYKQQLKYDEEVVVSIQHEKDSNIFIEELKTPDGKLICQIKQKRENI